MITKSNFMGEDLPGDEPMVGVPLYLLNGETGLSSKACWYLAVIRTRPKGQGFTVDELGKPFNDGIRTTTAAIDELEAAGYLLRVQMRAESGAFAGKKWYSSYYPRFKKNESEQEPETYASTDITFRRPRVQNTDTTKRQVGVQNVAPTIQNVKSVKNAQPTEILPVSIEPKNQSGPKNGVGALLLSSISIPATVIEQDNKEKKEKPPTGSRRKLTEVGELLAQEYSKWRLAKHGQAYDLAKVSDGAAKAFNSMGQTLMTKYSATAQKAASGFATILSRENELDAKYYQPKLFSPTRMEQEFLAIVNLLARKPGATPAASTIAAPEQYNATQRNYFLNYLNMWRRKFGLPKVEAITEQDVELCHKIGHNATHSIHPPHPQDTHIAAEWLALNQPVHA